jgi:hypothetical protein
MENQDKSKFNDHLRERTIQMAATLYWLEYLICVNFLDADKTNEIYSEVEQLVRLFNAIKSTMKIKIGGKKCEI